MWDVLTFKNRSDGKRCDVPAHNVHVKNIKAGDVVSFSYENSARREVPLNPKIFRVRCDLDWNDVLLSDSRKNEVFLNGVLVKE